LARITTEDPHAGLPDESELGHFDGALELYSDDVAVLETPWKIEQARLAERAALDFDPRITNSEGGSFGSNLNQTAFANSLGFSGSYRTSSCSLSAVPVARDGDRMERDYWYSIARRAGALEPAAEVGRKAGERVVRRLNARKLSTRKAPVIFEPRMARSLVSHLFEAVSGDAIYRRASFLADKIGERVAASGFTLVDDATIPGLYGTSPFDDEGVPSRRTVVIEDGILRSYLLNSYTARKLGLKTTGNASRGITGNAGIGHGNLYVGPGSAAVADMIRQAGTGLIVTELMGFGVNVVTGDYSRGASGLWFENGEIAYPVAEVTIASTLQEMLAGVGMVGSDLDFRGTAASPSLLIGEMTISGN
jgi:PmbA protein